MGRLAIHTYENFPKTFHIFHLADFSKVSTFVLETFGIGRSMYNPTYSGQCSNKTKVPRSEQLDSLCYNYCELFLKAMIILVSIWYN